MSTSPGETIGRYQIIAELGRGGMATVYRAFDPQVHRDVAIKLLPRQFTHDSSFRGRFAREAKIVAALDHPAIVPVLDYGEEGDQPYLVMRLMSGGTLADKLEAGPLSLMEVGRILNRVAPALDAAHRRGAIHRDLKPSNILFDQWGEPYLADFGIVKLSESTVSTLSQYALGTPAYMSPEQIEGKAELDGRSDVYALGVILFEMLTGGRPYEATTPMGLMMQHMNEPIPDVQTRLNALPPDTQSIINRAMAKRRDDRYPTATTLATDVAYMAGLPTPTPPPLTPSTPLPIPSRPVTASRPQPASPPQVDPTQVMVPDKPNPISQANQPLKQIQPGASSRRVQMWAIGIGGLVLLATLAVIIVAAILIIRGGDNDTAANNTNTNVASEENGDSSGDSENVSNDGTNEGSDSEVEVPEDIEWLEAEWDLFLPFPLATEPFASEKPLITQDNAVDLVEWARFMRGAIEDIEYSPDGAWIGAAASEGIYLYEAESLDLVQFQPAIDGQLAFSPNEEIAAVSSEGNIQLWELGSGEPLMTLPDDEHYTGDALIFSPDGQYLAATRSEGEVQVWTDDGELAMTLQGDRGRAYSLAFSPDSTQLAVATEQAILIWNVNSRTIQHTLTQPEIGFSDLAYIDDTILLAGSFDSGFFLWDSNDGELIQASGAEVASSGVVAASTDGMFATGSYDAVELWYEGDESPRYRLRSEGGATTNLAFSPDGTILIAGSDNHIARWRVDTDPPEPVDLFAAHMGGIRDIAFAPDGQTLAMMTPNSYAYVWQTNNGHLEHTFTNETQDVFCLTYGPDGNLVVGSFSSAVQGWDITEGNVQFVRENEEYTYVLDVAVSPDNEWIAAARDNGTILIMERGGRPRQVISAHEGFATTAVAFLESADALILVSGGGDGAVKLWQLNDREFKLLYTYGETTEPIYALASHGTLFAASNGAFVVRFYRVTDVTRLGDAYLGEITAEGLVNSLAFSPDEELVAMSNTNENLEIWPVPNEEVGTAPFATQIMYGMGGGGVAFSPDGTLLATAGQSGLQLWAVEP